MAEQITKGVHDWTHPAADCEVPGCDHITRRTCEGAENLIAYLRETVRRRTDLLCKADPRWAKQAEENLMRALFSEDPEGERVYVASRASVPERPAMWRRLRDDGYTIVSSWIDEAGQGETASFADLWKRVVREIRSATRFVLYVEHDDFPLKGALVEVGVALAASVPVYVVAPGVTIGADYRPIGSWLAHPLVVIEPDILKAMGILAKAEVRA